MIRKNRSIWVADNPLKAELAKNYEDYEWLYIRGWIENNPMDRRDACPTNRVEESKFKIRC